VSSKLRRVKFRALALLACGVVLIGGCGQKVEVHSDPAPASSNNSATQAINFAEPKMTTGCPSAACDQLLKQVADGTKINTIPDGMTPALKDIRDDLRRPEGGQCDKLPMEGLKDAQQPCIFTHGAPDAPLLVLVGDSQAWAWATAIDGIAADLGYRLGLVYHAGCKMPDLEFPEAVGYTDAHCKEWAKDAVDWINQHKPAAVISARAHSVRYNHVDYANGYAARLKQMAAPDRKLFVMGDVPTLHQDAAACLSAHSDAALKCMTPIHEAITIDDQQAAVDAGKQSGAAYINVVPFLCTLDQCPAIIGPNFAAYQDQYHLTSTYAEQLEPVVKQALGLTPA
jgi:hypothetical protein